MGSRVTTRCSVNWGPHSTGKSCLYIKNVEKVNQKVLEKLITESLEAVEAGIAKA